MRSGPPGPTSLMDLHAHDPAGVDRSAFKQYVPILADTAPWAPLPFQSLPKAFP